jgi:zinc metalloprotease ZmpB
MPFDLTDNVNAERDDQGNVQHLEHFQQPYVGVGVGMEADALNDAGIPFAPATTPQALAAQYLQEVAPLYGIDESMLPSSGEDFGLAADDPGDGGPAGSKLELTEEKDLMGTTTIAYQQTYNGLPVWEAGVSVTMLPNPLRVTASQSTIHNDVVLPEADAFDGGPSFGPEAITPTTLKQLLGLTKGKPTINGTRPLVYR